MLDNRDWVADIEAIGAIEEADCMMEEDENIVMLTTGDNGTGAMHFVHIVDVDVLSIVDITVVTTSLG